MAQRIENGADFRGPLLAAGSAGSSGQVLTSAGAGAAPTWGTASGFTGGTLTSNLKLAAGTTSLSPLTFQSGTNLTTATAGALEYDGNVMYSTPASRGVSPSMMFFRLNSGVTGSNVTTAQSVFGVGVTLASSTVYAFEALYTLAKTTGSGTSVSMGFGFGGTATINNILHCGTGVAAGFGVTTIPLQDTSAESYISNTASNQTASGASAQAAVTVSYLIRGTVSINSGGTFIPQYTLSAAPSGYGAYTTFAGSYFAIWPIGASGANISVGPWA
jgi:hypothetical protein